ncbi:hypothetical protein P885DRAFT_81372 [Corynascus similis CBS 632.67]
MATWHSMTEHDIPDVMRVADEVHHNLPEQESTFRERLSLFPEGCMVLVREEEKDNHVLPVVGGYLISFPIRHGKPPALDQPLGEIPPDADQYYIHDLALLPAFRRGGAGTQCIDRVLDSPVVRRYPTTCLISVYGTAPFWTRFGFARPEPPTDVAMIEKLCSYGPDAVYLIRRN